MPSFDVVSELDSHQVTNAVDQANRIVTTRYDFKGINADFERQGNSVIMTAEADFQVKQLYEILLGALQKCGIDLACLDAKEVTLSGKTAKRVVELREGIDKELAKKMVKFVKDKKMKVQASIQGDELRVTGKKRDDLQQVIAAFKAEDFGMPLQFKNFRD